MEAKILIDGQATPLQLYVGVLVTYVPPMNRLICANVIVLAENSTEASALIAMNYPHYELQALTCISQMRWFTAILLDSDHPTVLSLRSFFIGNVEEVPDDFNCLWDTT